MRAPDDIRIGDDASDWPVGIVVVVDVIRAFTTAAAALDAGARGVLCVASVDEALTVQHACPAALLAGERSGLAPAGFPLANSPREMRSPHIADALIVLVSQNGTPGLVRSRRAPVLLAAAAVNVSATAAWIRSQEAAGPVRIVCTDATGEDQACAAHLATLLAGDTPDVRITRIRIGDAVRRHVEIWRRFHTPAACHAFRADAELCSAVDAYDFAMIGRVHGTSVALRAVPVSAEAARSASEAYG